MSTTPLTLHFSSNNRHHSYIFREGRVTSRVTELRVGKMSCRNQDSEQSLLFLIPEVDYVSVVSQLLLSRLVWPFVKSQKFVRELCPVILMWFCCCCCFVFERTSQRPKTLNDTQVWDPGDVMFTDRVLISDRQDKQVKDGMHGNWHILCFCALRKIFIKNLWFIR